MNNILGYTDKVINEELETGQNDETNETKKDISSSLLFRFEQQKLSSWQPVITPTCVILFFFVIGVVFIVIGVILLDISNNTIECVAEYPEPNNVNKKEITIVNITSDVCRPSKNSDGDNIVALSGNLFIYYQLTNFYQNNRQYMASRNDQQLRGQVFDDPKMLSSCIPVISDENGQILSPCGLVAASVFNDTYTILDGNNMPITIDEDSNTIILPTDIQLNYKNPNKEEVSGKNINEWLSEEIFPGKVENPHFIVWMRIAALSNFKKIYGKLKYNNEIKLPIQVQINNRYPTTPFNGKKAVVISQVTWMGGKNSLIGIAYLTVGSLSFAIALFYLFKNYRSPRIIGDVRYLNWKLKKGHSD